MHTGGKKNKAMNSLPISYKTISCKYGFKIDTRKHFQEYDIQLTECLTQRVVEQRSACHEKRAWRVPKQALLVKRHPKL